MPAHPNSSPIAGSIISVCASGIVFAKPSPAPWPVMPPVEMAQIPLATWSPPYTWLFHASDQIAFRSTSLCMGPGIILASTGILSSNKNPLTTTSAITADSLSFFFKRSMYNSKNCNGNTGCKPYIFKYPDGNRIQNHCGNHLHKIAS